MDYKRINEFRLLGLTIAYYRKLRGLTQAELAEATNLSRTHISNIEAPNGKTSISLNKLFDIADCSRSKFLTNFLKTFDKDFREIFPGFTDKKRRAEPSAFLTIILQITPTLQRRLPPHLRTLQAPLPKLQSHHG